MDLVDVHFQGKRLAVLGGLVFRELRILTRTNKMQQLPCLLPLREVQGSNTDTLLWDVRNPFSHFQDIYKPGTHVVIARMVMSLRLRSGMWRCGARPDRP